MKKAVLIVDDNQDARFVMSAVLNFDGYRILTANDGIDGVAMAREHLPALILMDLRMPRMDGFQAAETLRGDDVTRVIPIVAVSADTLAPGHSSRIPGLFHSFLLKPMEAAQLQAHVRSIIGDP